MPQKKPRKTSLKSSKIQLVEDSPLSNENAIQSPIRISSRANKSTSNKFNSDEYLVYYPSKRSPLKTPDSVHKKRKRLENTTSKGNVAAAASNGTSKPCRQTQAVGGGSRGLTYKAFEAMKNDGGQFSPGRNRGSAGGINLTYPLKLKTTTAGSGNGGHFVGGSVDQILPIAVSGDGRFTCTELVSRGILGIGGKGANSTAPIVEGTGEDDDGGSRRRSGLKSGDFSPGPNSSLVLLRNHPNRFYKDEEPFLEGYDGEEPEPLYNAPRSIFTTQTELELGTGPTSYALPSTVPSRKLPDRPADVRLPLYTLCRNWVRTKLNRSALSQDGVGCGKEDGTTTFGAGSLKKLQSSTNYGDGSGDILGANEGLAITRLPPPIPLAEGGPFRTRIPRPLDPRERTLIWEEYSEGASSSDKGIDGDVNKVTEDVPTPPTDSKVPENGPSAAGSPRAVEISLNRHLGVWKRVRRNWILAGAKDDARYGESLAVLTRLYERTATASVTG